MRALMAHMGRKLLGDSDPAVWLSGTKIALFIGQSNDKGYALVANQFTVFDLCFAYPNVGMIERHATVPTESGGLIVWTYERPEVMSPPTPPTLPPVPLSPRSGDPDLNGDAGPQLGHMRTFDRAWPQRWGCGVMDIPSSSMDNWKTNADGSNYPTTPPHLCDQIKSFATAVQVKFNGRIWIVVDYQGESDAQVSGLASTWESRKVNQIVDIRSHLGWNVPYVLPILHSGSPGAFNSTVRAAAVNIGNNTTGNTPRVLAVNTDSVTSTSTLHHTAGVYGLLGVLVGKAGLSFLGIPEPPLANFTWSWSGTNVSFTDASTPGTGRTIVSRVYDFGDGATSTSTNPSHNYAALGTYTVTETITDDVGLTNGCTRLVTCAAGTWPIDIAGFAVPANSTHWTNLCTAAGLAFIPNASRRPGSVAASPVPDDIAGAFPLTVTGATVAFQQPVPGSNVLAIKTVHNTTDSLRSVDAALPDLATTSCCTGEIYCHWTLPTGNRGIFAMGTTEAAVTVNNSNPPHVVIRHNTQATTGAVGLDNRPHIHFLRHNQTADNCTYVSDLETITVAFAPSVTGKRESAGLTNLQAAGGQHILHFRFDGANAEALGNAQLRTLGRCMGFFMP